MLHIYDISRLRGKNFMYCLVLNIVQILFMYYRFDIQLNMQLLRVFEVGNRSAVTVNIGTSAVLWH